MESHPYQEHPDPTHRLYSFLVEEEDARVCKDIPAESCTDVPANFFRLGGAQVLTKLADELSNAKTVLPWVLTSMGAPSFLLGFLVPIRESGSLLPQLFIAAAVRKKQLRKRPWVVGGLLQALILLLLGVAASVLEGPLGGATVIGLLILFSLARGLVSVASKDVIGKTIPKTRRGRLTGFTSATAGSLALVLGGLLGLLVQGEPDPLVLTILVTGAAVLWLAASLIMGTIQEAPGATEGGKNAIREAVGKLVILRTDSSFRRFVWVRGLLVSTGLAAPFYVAIAREAGGGGNLLALFVVASGLAAAVSSGFWGRWSDASSRTVLVIAALMASSLGLSVFFLDLIGVLDRAPWIAPMAFFLLAVAHSGIRVGRKTYLLDMAGGAKRTDYVAVSNTVIGVVLLVAGTVGFLTPVVGPSGVLLVLSVLGFAGAWGGRALPEAN